MVVNSCSSAVAEDELLRAQGITDVTYTDVACADDSTFNKNLQEVTVW